MNNQPPKDRALRPSELGAGQEISVITCLGLFPSGCVVRSSRIRANMLLAHALPGGKIPVAAGNPNFLTGPYHRPVRTGDRPLAVFTKPVSQPHQLPAPKGDMARGGHTT